MPSTRSHVRKLAAICMLLMLFIVGSMVLISRLFNNIDCQLYNYNDKLNGGVKEVNGKKYTVNICGSGVNNSRFFGDSMEYVQLIILDEHAELLAKRNYKVFWDGQPGHEPIKVNQNSIVYQNDEKQQDYTITMPTTRLDWVSARVSLF